MVSEIAYELLRRNIRPPVYMFLFASVVIIDTNQLMYSENFAKRRKRSQRMSLSFFNLKNVQNLIYVHKKNSDFLLFFLLT